MERLAWLLILSGVVLRVTIFLTRGSLWLDEAALAIHVLPRSSRELFTPVGYGQAAPPGFLMVVKAVTMALGTNEHALRLVALVSGLAALPLSWAIARRSLGPAGALIAIALVAFTPPLVSYCAEFKPYESDAAVALVLLASGVWIARRGPTWRRLLALSAVGTAAIVLSYPAVFVLAGVGASLFADQLRRGRRITGAALALAALPWLATFAFLFLVNIRPTRWDGVLMDFWRETFMPFPPRSSSDLRWLSDAFLNLFRYPYGARAGLAAAGLFVVGAAAAGRRSRLVGTMLILPLAAAAAASAVRAYPFEGRLLLFAMPSVILLIGHGAEELWRWPILPRVAGGAMLLALALWSPPWIVRHVILDPPRHEELRPALEYLAAHLRGGDRVYVYYFTRSAFAYYTEVSPVAGAGAIRDVAPILGQGVRLAHEAIGDVRDLDALDRAARVWLVFSHARTLGGVDEEARFGEQLSAMGCRRRDEFRVVGASIRLFECRAGISGS